jgi:hypothetical protein
LDTLTNSCVDAETGSLGKIPSWPQPPRRFRDPESLLSTSVFRNEFYDSGSGWCADPAEEPVSGWPSFVLTNGSAVFAGIGVVNIACVDSDLDTDAPVALFCRKPKPEMNTPKPEVHVPKPADDPRGDCKPDSVCLPKCCPAGEVFDVAEMRCSRANATSLYNADVYKFEHNKTGGKSNAYNLSVEPNAIVTRCPFDESPFRPKMVLGQIFLTDYGKHCTQLRRTYTFVSKLSKYFLCMYT